MKIVLINGSARKEGNTAEMLKKVREGAISKGAEIIEDVNLYDLDYKGCYACYACKVLNGKHYGHCPIKDDLKHLFQKIEEADAFVLGTPIYWSNLSGQTRSFIERLFFQYLVYDEPYSSLAPKLKTALLTTMNISADLYEPSGLAFTIEHIQTVMQLLFGSCDVLNLFETVQFEDYSKYVYSMKDKEEKSVRNPKIHDKDLLKAFELGVSLAD